MLSLALIEDLLEGFSLISVIFCDLRRQLELGRLCEAIVEELHALVMVLASVAEFG